MESYTGPTVWRLMQEEFVACGLEQITPTSAKAMAEENGWTLLDVRPKSDYNERHCWGAVNAQYYRAMDASDPKNWGKAAVSAMIFPERIGSAYLNVTENENFLDEVLECVEWGAPLVVYDDVGGVIGEPGVNFENGVQTPSLMAIYELAARGWGTDNLMHMAGGLLFWDEVDRFDCGEIDEEDA
jgi:rhodanese-related sulfurtransferase